MTKIDQIDLFVYERILRTYYMNTKIYFDEQLIIRYIFWIKIYLQKLRISWIISNYFLDFSMSFRNEQSEVKGSINFIFSWILRYRSEWQTWNKILRHFVPPPLSKGGQICSPLSKGDTAKPRGFFRTIYTIESASRLILNHFAFRFSFV